MFRKKLTPELTAGFIGGEMEWLNPGYPMRAIITNISLLEKGSAQILAITTGRTVTLEPDATLERNRFKLNSETEGGETLYLPVARVCSIEPHRVELLVNRCERLTLMDTKCPFRIFPKLGTFREAA